MHTSDFFLFFLLQWLRKRNFKEPVVVVVACEVKSSRLPACVLDSAVDGLETCYNTWPTHLIVMVTGKSKAVSLVVLYKSKCQIRSWSWFFFSKTGDNDIIVKQCIVSNVFLEQRCIGVARVLKLHEHNIRPWWTGFNGTLPVRSSVFNLENIQLNMSH
jgi:hypothetical protein